MRYFKKFLFVIVTGFTILFLSNTKIYSQMSRIDHDLATLYSAWGFTLDWNNAPSYYPNGMYNNEVSLMMQPFMLAKSIIESQGGSPSIDRYWYRYAPNEKHVTEALMIYKKHQPPSIIVDGVQYAPAFKGTVDKTIDSDSKMVARVHWWGSLGGYFYPTTRTWVNQLHDDYIIFDSKWQLSFDLNGDGTDDMPDQTVDLATTQFINLHTNKRATAQYGISSGATARVAYDWHYATTYPQTLIPTAPRQNLVLSVSRNCDTKTYRVKPYGWTGTWPDFDESGFPIGPQTGTLTLDNCDLAAPEIGGIVTLHADKNLDDATYNNDDIAQPRACVKYDEAWSWYDFTNLFALVNGERANKLDVIETALGFEDPVVAYGTGNTLWQAQEWGPYKMTKNQTFKSVYAVGFGSVGLDRARQGGLDFMKYYRDGVGTFNTAAKNALLDQSLDSLKLNMNRAYWNFYVKKYNIDDPLGVPDIKVTSGPDKIDISWGYPTADGYKDPDTGVEDFKEWRLYRKRGHYQVAHTSDNGYRTYELIGVFPKATTSYADAGVIRGEAYHYCVTAVDDGSQNSASSFLVPKLQLESSKYVNISTGSAQSFKPGSLTTNNVVIVPNPYSISTGTSNQMNYTGKTNDIHFMNLPFYCTLKIYTSTGDLIKTIPHTSGSGDEIWKDMRTDGNQSPVSGVYIVVIDNAKNANKDPLPKKFYKFVIVR